MGMDSIYRNRRALLAAHDYADHGWAALPVPSGGKFPTGAWRQWQQKRPTKGDLEQMWRGESNVAILTGRVSGLVVVDVDPGGEAPTEPTGRVARTGRGTHYYYRYPERGTVRTRAGVRPHVDVRADGGLVIAPPSIHASGREYEWVTEGEPGECPAWLVEEDEPAVTDVPEDAPGEGWVAQILRGNVGKGGRNDAIARLAGYCAGKQLPVDVALTMALSASRRFVPPLPDTEVATTVRSVYSTAVRRGKVREQVSEERRQELADAGILGSPVFPALSLADFGLRYGGETSWVIPDWLPERAITFLAAPPGTFKTWLTLDLVLSVATGRPFLGKYTPNLTGPCLYIQQEDDKAITLSRIASILSRDGVQLPDPAAADVSVHLPATDIPVYLPDISLTKEAHPLQLGDDAAVEALEELIAAVRPVVVVIDPFYSVAGNVEGYMADAASKLLPLRRMRDKYGCAFVFVHHTKKDAKGLNRGDMWGSALLNAAIEVGWHVRKDPQCDATVYLARHTKISAELPAVRIGFDIHTQHPLRYHTDVRRATAEELQALEDGPAPESSAGTSRRGESNDTDRLVALLAERPHTLGELVQRSGVAVRRVQAALQKMPVLMGDRQGELVYSYNPGGADD